MQTLAQNILACKTAREKAAQTAAEVLKSSMNISESELCKKWSENLYKGGIHASGWYSPPPRGLAALFEHESLPQRVAYDNLRKQEFWPLGSKVFGQNSIGYIYASPVAKLSGIIGDFGMTVYSGSNKNILSHIKSILETVEQAAEYAQVGMEFREIYNFCQKLMAEKGLNNKRTMAYTETAGTNIGHTVPWTYELPTTDELAVINGANFETLKNLISKKRVHLNGQETFKIPSTVAFTLEPRAESNVNPSLPMASLHLIITFVDGKKEILANFNPIFQVLEMDKFIQSRFS